MYTVKRGDTLYKIATKYNTTVKKIMDLNYLKSTNITPGEVLRIPETYTKDEDMTMPNYTNYIVKRGDTLYSIAKANNLTVDTIIKDNSLVDNNLKIGSTLKLRIPSSSTVTEECYGADYTPPSEEANYSLYTVKKGDNLYNIAKLYGTSASAIMFLNDLPNTNLSIGKILKIPLDNQISTTTYIVKNGDSLYAIAQKYNTTVDTIKKKNNLTSNNLKIGQKLII